MGRFCRTDEVERPVGSCGMFGVCGRSSAALGREIVSTYTATSVFTGCCMHGVPLVMLCASAASCQMKRLCKGLASKSAKKNGNDFHMEGQWVELGWKRKGWVIPFFPRRLPECLREVTHRSLSGGSMDQFEKESCGSVLATGKAPKSDTAKWQSDPPRRVGRRF